MKNRVLTIEQMEKLESLGLDITEIDSNLTWIEIDPKYRYVVFKGHLPSVFPNEKRVPTITLQDILELLPFYLTVNGNHYHLEWCNTTELRYLEDDYDREPDTLVQKDEANLLDTAYEMLVYLLENNITKPA